MQIFYNYTNPNNQKNYSTNLAFKNTLKQSAIQKGVLKRETKLMVEDFLHAYRNILNLLEQKTPKGIAFFNEAYPNISIGDNLIFYNCGKENDTIVLRKPESNKYHGLSYMARRKNSTNSKMGEIIDAFMLDGEENLIKNFDKNHSRKYPENRVYLSEKDIEEQEADIKLQKILQDLDPAMLAFRKILSKYSQEFNKIPDGKIPFDIGINLKVALKTSDEILALSKKIPHKMWLKLNKEFQNYLSIPGLKSYAFKNLGEDKLTINLSNFIKDGEEFQRLSVYNAEGKNIRVFLIKNNIKFIKNLIQNIPTYVPNKFTHADSEEIEKDFLPEFQHYFKLYFDKLSEYKKYISQNVDLYHTQEIPIELNYTFFSNMSDAVTYYESAKSTLKKFSPKKTAEIKARVARLDLNAGIRGMKFDGFKTNNTVHFLPIKNKNHSGLTRITITNKDTDESSMYLIKDFKYIVKNFNPQNPQIIPENLIFANEGELDTNDLNACSWFIKNKMQELMELADKEFEKRNIIKRPKEEIQREKEKNGPLTETREYKAFARECKKQLLDVMSLLDKGSKEFNKAFEEMHEKILEFYQTHKKFK